MRLKTKNLNWFAGRPVVILGEIASKKLNIHVDEKIYVRHAGRKIFAVVDIFQGLVKANEIGLSKEISSRLGNKEGEQVDIESANLFEGARLIRKKIEGGELNAEELKIIVTEITNNNLTEAELAFFLSAEKLVGMTTKETIALTEAMISTGRKLDFGREIVADKHCIGGIAGNRTTPIVVSICAAAGLIMPKNSSRAITSAAGTADVIETLAKVELSGEEIKKVVGKAGACLVWNGALNLSPSDDKLIHVERLLNLDVEPQLLASIMSKKIAAGSNRILIDIPYGGGKMKTKRQAKKLGNKFKIIAEHFNVKIKPVYTDGKQPIGNGMGPVLEMIDVLSVLRNDPDCPKDLKEKAILLASEILSLCGIYFTRIKARKILESGKAYEKFKEIINAQNGSKDFDERVTKLKIAKHNKPIYADYYGNLEIGNSKLNELCRILGTPETTSAGIYLHKHNGVVKEGEKIMTLYSESPQRLEEGLKFLKEVEPFKIK
ncbi:MAG: thymidine phosphorylase [archaeon]